MLVYPFWSQNQGDWLVVGSLEGTVSFDLGEQHNTGMANEWEDIIGVIMISIIKITSEVVVSIYWGKTSGLCVEECYVQGLIWLLRHTYVV